MIRGIDHNGLKRLYERNDDSRIPPEHRKKVRRIMNRLDVSKQPSDMNLPGFVLHSLRGDLSGHWAVRVSGNWRVTFRFQYGDVWSVNLTDYH